MKKLLLLCALTMMFTGLYCWDVTIYNSTGGLLKVSYDNLIQGQWKPRNTASRAGENLTIPISEENETCDIKFTYPDEKGGQVTIWRPDLRTNSRPRRDVQVIKQEDGTYTWR